MTSAPGLESGEHSAASRTAPGRQPDVEVAIVGAGLAGVGIAIALMRAGLTDFVIIDRESDFGGTWHVNRYPDVGADIPGLLYQFSFAKHPWSRVFPKGEEVKSYIDALVAEYRLRDRSRLGTEVKSRTWDEEHHLWRHDLGDAGELTSRFAVSADGMFIEPRRPDITGLDDFQGDVMLSQQWRHDYDFTGKRVGIIGTGASGVQIIPRLARSGGHLTVFQRRGAWVFPKPDLPIPRPVRWLLTRVPGLYAALFAVLTCLVGNYFGWLATHGSRLERFLWAGHVLIRGFIRLQVRDAETRRGLLPTYPMVCKRPTISNHYYAAFDRPDVSLVTQPIERADAHGLLTVDGEHHRLDVLVLATGFRMAASSTGRRGSPLRGAGGFELADYYERTPDAAEFQGLLLPDMPNNFIVCGRYSWAGPSHCSIVERAAIIIVRMITETKRQGATRFQVTAEAAARFSDRMIARQEGSFAHTTGCRAAKTYFLDEHGVSSVYRPTSMTQAMHEARNLSMTDFEFGRLRTAPNDR
ncbi:NAD(P)/FAD-dependent oxidoreductase [Mycobacterium sp. CPCC 205372]|uniref:NAD(P)/FAD-dependent oxidoreductase n=1 Tax=Mycobacterium hippophais TaxID=3016340 RepID=A0ABT4PS24_9MYCO|nr:NAD(P)/FAD-dependent oxidoreductase [Mycobacterium hippophais]MCZ8379368.1 NAD(P)/FAD-dependent oxidoreductase [Mycobacterium hippophais]